MFGILGALLLSSSALAATVSADSASCTSSDSDPPSERSLSLIRRVNKRADIWAGFQHTNWYGTYQNGVFVQAKHTVGYATVTFAMPVIDSAATPNSKVTFALALGSPSIRGLRDDRRRGIILVGVQVTVTNGVATCNPVYGFDLFTLNTIPVNLNRDNWARPINFGDHVTLQIYDISESMRKVAVRNRDPEDSQNRDNPRNWGDSQDLPTNAPTCLTHTSGMVVGHPMEHGNQVRRDPLTNFGPVTFFAHRIIYHPVSSVPAFVAPWPQVIVRYDMKSYHGGTLFARASPGDTAEDTRVSYVIPTGTVVGHLEGELKN